jgi:hypothetical protein
MSWYSSLGTKPKNSEYPEPNSVTSSKPGRETLELPTLLTVNTVTDGIKPVLVAWKEAERMRRQMTASVVRLWSSHLVLYGRPHLGKARPVSVATES